MSDAVTEHTSSFPAPVRIDGYFAWAWKLFRACFLSLGGVYVAGVVLTGLTYYVIVRVLMIDVLEVRQTVQVRAVAYATEITLTALTGTLLAAVAAPVFLARLAGRVAGLEAGWRRFRPKAGHVVVSALYVAMPMLVLVVVLPITQIVLLPAVLGPPVLVHVIVWEGLPFRDAATRAKNLLSGHWSRVASALLVITSGSALVLIVALALLSLVLPELDSTGLVGSPWPTIVAGAVAAPVWLFVAAAGTVAYVDLRARFEELDHAALAAEAGEPSGAPTPG